eukprot:829490-Alexandrium_andersonii.AAC.1
MGELGFAGEGQHCSARATSWNATGATAQGNAGNPGELRRGRGSSGEFGRVPESFGELRTAPESSGELRRVPE